MCMSIYRRSGIECEILLIANCKFLYKTQSQEKEYAMNITCDHTPLLKSACSSTRDHKHARVLDRVFDVLTCMYIQLSIVFDSSSQLLSQAATVIKKSTPLVGIITWLSLRVPLIWAGQPSGNSSADPKDNQFKEELIWRLVYKGLSAVLTWHGGRLDKPWRLNPTLDASHIKWHFLLCVRWATSAGRSPGLLNKEEWQKKKTQGGCVSILDRLRKRGRKKNRGGRMSILRWWATRLRKRGKRFEEDVWGYWMSY